MNKRIKRIFRKIGRWTVNILFWLCMALVVYVFMQIFLLTSFKIPSGSMEPELVAGDRVLVNKAVYGARLFNLFASLRNEQVKIYRTPGLRNIRRNDVLVCHIPYPNHSDKIEMHILKYYVKRCVALPGDTFYIDNGIYKVKNLADTLGHYSYQVGLSGMADSVFHSGIFHCFPFDSAYRWTIKHFGPLYVPGKGSVAVISVQSIALYKNLIEYETGKGIEIKKDQVYLGQELLQSYTFTKNYYFMAGDWVFDSRDSRYWGLLPEDLIVGKVAYVWKSIDPATRKFRWERFFKVVQ